MEDEDDPHPGVLITSEALGSQIPYLLVMGGNFHVQVVGLLRQWHAEARPTQELGMGQCHENGFMNIKHKASLFIFVHV